MPGALTGSARATGPASPPHRVEPDPRSEHSFLSGARSPL